MELPFHRVAIIGVGLIGGSLGLALKRAFPPLHVRGVGRDPKRLAVALEMRAVDDTSVDMEAGLSGRDLVILATPIQTILDSLPLLGKCIAPGTVITDVGSTKRVICRSAWSTLPSSVEFIGGHPIAGREVLGVENARPGLFENAPYVLCPNPVWPPENLHRLRILAESIGARCVSMTPDEHDAALARLSHLPQLVSTGLAVAAGRSGLDLAGSGFRDLVRLAGSPYSIWEGIFRTNADNIDLALDGFIRQMQKMGADLKQNRLSSDFEDAAEVYSKLRKIQGFD